MIATYEGKQRVRIKRSKRRTKRENVSLNGFILEPVPIVALFFDEFPGHMEARRTT